MRTHKTIVAGTDFSKDSALGLEAAVAMANRSGARRLHLVHVVHATAAVLPQLITEPRSDEASQRARAQASERLERLELPETSARVTREVRYGSPARELARVAEQLHADLVVVASHGYSGLARLVLGSAANALIRVSHCPVLVVGGKASVPQRFERVIAAVDLSPISSFVLANAVGVAHASKGRIHLLSMFEHPILTPNPDGLLPHYLSQDELEGIAGQHRAAVEKLVQQVPRYGVEIEIEIVSNSPAAPVILELANSEDADLIVIGTSGRNAWHRMILGSTANHVLVKAPCPVLVVPQEAREHVRDENLAPLLGSGG